MKEREQERDIERQNPSGLEPDVRGGVKRTWDAIMGEKKRGWGKMATQRQEVIGDELRERESKGGREEPDAETRDRAA